MSERKQGWSKFGFAEMGHYNTTLTWGRFTVALRQEAGDEQFERLAAWLNHIAPDGVIPPVPNDKDGKHE